MTPDVWTGTRHEWCQENAAPAPAELTYDGRVEWRVERVEDPYPGDDASFKEKGEWCVRKARQRGLPELSLAVCAWVESTFNSQAVGDDGHAFGLVQQKPQFWGRGETLEERKHTLLHPESAAMFFLDAMLRDTPEDFDGSDEELGNWIQTVQRSSYPDAYYEKTEEVRSVLRGELD